MHKHTHTHACMHTHKQTHRQSLDERTLAVKITFFVSLITEMASKMRSNMEYKDTSLGVLSSKTKKIILFPFIARW